MKNLAIIVLIAIVALVLYQQVSNGPVSDKPQSPPAANPAGSNSEAIEPADGANESVESNQEPIKQATSSLISAAAEGAEVYIISPKNGEVVSSPFTVKFGIKNMTVAKAGENIEYSGHHHLLINVEELPDMTQPLPATDQIIHFGGAQTETEVELPKGMHSLKLLLGNYLHIPHDKPVISKEISVIVD